VGYVTAQVNVQRQDVNLGHQVTPFCFSRRVCESSAVRAVALLGPHAKEHHLRPFELPGVNLFSGNELDPTDQPDAVLIFGGDGTIHRHLGGLALKQIPTLVVPIGSANDFAQSIGMNGYPTAQAAWQRFLSADDNIGQIDLGKILPLSSDEVTQSAASAEHAAPWQGESLENMHFVPDGPRGDLPRMAPRIMQSQLRRMTDAEREISRVTYFSCIAGTGLDSVVNRRALKQSHWLRSHGGYVVALLQTLGSFRAPHISVSVADETGWKTVIDERGFLLAAGNGPQYGNGMRITHQARMNDGMLDLCFVREMSKLRLLRFFPIVYRGAHIGMKEVEYLRAARLRIVCDPVMEVFADGEPICQTPVEFGVQPDALRVILPAKS
jgi:diacylglycerol kinase family enzyme